MLPSPFSGVLISTSCTPPSSRAPAAAPNRAAFPSLLPVMLARGLQERGEKRTQGKMLPSLVAFVPLSLCRACTCSAEHSI